MMLKIFLSFILILPLSGAGPVTHVFLTDTYLRLIPGKYTPEEEQLFLIGSLFPDIRYLGTVTREATHTKIVTMQDVVCEPSPFKAGMLFHSFVDIEREKILNALKAHTLFVSISPELRPSFMKLLEDELLYDSINQERLNTTLKKVYPEEAIFDIDYKDVLLWHMILWRYFRSSPQQMLSLFSDQGWGLFNIPPTAIDDWKNYLAECSQDTNIRQMIYAYLEELIVRIEENQMEKVRAIH